MNKKSINAMDEKKRQVQLEFIQKQIIEGNNKDHFLVINAEAGSGKTMQMESALAELYKLNPNIKTLVVQKFKDTAEEKEGNICTSHARINKQAGKEIAIAVDNDNYKKIKGELKNYPIIIITHERYKILSKNARERGVFAKERINLIIDEEINMLDIDYYNNMRTDTFASFLINDAIKKLYLECVEPIKTFLKADYKNSTKFPVLNGFEIKTKLIKLKKVLQENITTTYGEENNCQKNALVATSKKVEYMTKKDFLDEVDIINKFYNNIVLLYGNSLYAYDNNIKYWRLENNIILDANGGFNKIYKISNMFKCTNQSKISDHHWWDLFICPLATSKNAKKKYLNFYEKIKSFILENVGENDKALVVGNKIDEDKLDFITKNVSMNHYGNLIGRNDYLDCNVMLSIHTPNIPYYVHILKYIYYGGNYQNLDTSLCNRNNVMCFRDKDLESIRLTYLAGEIYQAVKRINRNMEVKEKDTKVFIFTNDSQAINLVIKELKNCNFRDFKIEVEKNKKDKTYDSTTRNVNSDRTKLVRYLSCVKPGKYKKKNIREELGISKAPNLSRLFNDQEVLAIIIERNIVLDNKHYIVVP